MFKVQPRTGVLAPAQGNPPLGPEGSQIPAGEPAPAAAEQAVTVAAQAVQVAAWGAGRQPPVAAPDAA